MAYSDYGGYAYKNGVRVKERSDCQISPQGDIFGKPGIYPGFVNYIEGGKDKFESRLEWPAGHVILGDGPIFVMLYKQNYLSIYRGPLKLDETSLLTTARKEAIKTWEDSNGEEFRYVDTDHFNSTEDPCTFEINGYKITVYWRLKDNYYQYAQIEQPDRNVWHGWTGYGVGAGLEDAGYGFSTKEQDETLWSLFNRPENKKQVGKEGV